MRMETKRNRINFSFEVHPEGSVDGLREIVTNDFKSRFGDSNVQIVINKTKDLGKVRVYRGYVEEII